MYASKTHTLLAIYGRWPTTMLFFTLLLNLDSYHGSPLFLTKTALPHWGDTIHLICSGITQLTLMCTHCKKFSWLLPNFITSLLCALADKMENQSKLPLVDTQFAFKFCECHFILRKLYYYLANRLQVTLQNCIDIPHAETSTHGNT